MCKRKEFQEVYDISKCNIDTGEGESQTALQRKIEISETENSIRELAQYSYKRCGRKLGE